MVRKKGNGRRHDLREDDDGQCWKGGHWPPHPPAEAAAAAGTYFTVGVAGRIDAVLAANIRQSAPSITRAQAQRVIKAGGVSCNGRVSRLPTRNPKIGQRNLGTERPRVLLTEGIGHTTGLQAPIRTQ